MDQRQQPRVNTTPPIDVEIIESSPPLHDQHSSEQTKAMNVSEGGMMYFSRISRKPGTTLRASFTLPNTTISIRVALCVVYCSLEWPNYHIGVQFKNLGIAERKLIREYVETELMNNDNS